MVLLPTIDGPMPMPMMAAPAGSDSGRLLSVLRDDKRW
jgi:hypothetical protein